MTEIRRAIPSDAGPLAGLHTASLPSSLLSVLGVAALTRYYTFVQASAKEVVWTALDDGNVIGGCVLSDEPHSVLGRFVRFAPLQLASELGVSAMRSRELRGRLVSRFREKASDGPHAPEVTQIFTDARRRGQGIGAQLLRVCEENLRTRHMQKYFVHTERDDNEAGIRFYRREGFVTIGESRSFGAAFLIMQKDLD